jgi:hypothetical protein
MNANLSWPSLLSVRLFKEVFSLQKQERRHSSPKQSLLATASDKKSRNIEFILAGRILHGSGT